MLLAGQTCFMPQTNFLVTSVIKKNFSYTVSSLKLGHTKIEGGLRGNLRGRLKGGFRGDSRGGFQGFDPLHPPLPLKGLTSFSRF